MSNPQKPPVPERAGIENPRGNGRFVVSRRSVLGAGAALAAASALPSWSPWRTTARASAPPTILSIGDVLAAPPFSFTYGGVASATLLASWPKTTATATQADGRIRHTVTWTAPDGLQVRWIGDEYPGYTTISWTVTFTQTGSANSAQLANVLAVDVTVTSLPSTDWSVRTLRGSFQSVSDFSPIDLALPTGTHRLFTTCGGRPTDGTHYVEPPSHWQYRAGQNTDTGAPGYFGSDQHTTPAAGARARFTFSGTQVSWIGPKNVDCGIAAVYLDGVQVATVDLYATTWLKQQTLFTSGTLTDATHVVEIVNTGRRNSAASGTLVSVDAFTFRATGAVTVDDSIGGISYTGTWTVAPQGGSPGYYQGTQHSSSAVGSTASFTFVGNSVSLIAPKNVDCGIAAVYVDGVQVASVDLYATTWLKQRTVWTSAPLSQGTHTVEVVNTGTGNPAATGTLVPVDAFSYTSSGPTLVDDTSPAITYGGAWNTAPQGGSPGYINETQHTSSTANASASFTFTGTQVTWIGPKNVDCGIGRVYLDGVQVATVDLYATSWLKQVPLWTSGTLTPGSHTIKIVNSGTSNAAASGTFVPIDAFLYTSTGTTTTYNDDDGAIDYLGDATATAIPNGWPFWNLDMVSCGMLVALGWPGQWGAEVSRVSATSVRWTGGMVLRDARDPSHTLQDGEHLAVLGLTDLWLAPGESIRTALVVVQPWNGGTPDDAYNPWRRWLQQYHVPRRGGGGAAGPLAPTQANDYFAPGQIDTAQDELTWVNAYGSHSATAGTGGTLDHWWLDAGWYARPSGTFSTPNGPYTPPDDWTPVGTWTADPVRFPNGLKPLTDRVRQLGMQAIVWFEPERVMPGTDIYVNHPTYLLDPKAGDTQWAGQAKLFDFGNAAARTWITSTFNSLITTSGIDFYREDFNIAPLPFWQNADPAGRQGLTQARYVDGHLQFWAGLVAAHPGMLIDSCASGGRRLDVLTLQYAVNLLRSDTVLQATANQSHIAALSRWVTVHGGAVRAENDVDDVYNLRSAMGPVFHEALDIRVPSAPWATLNQLAAEWGSVKAYYVQDFSLLTPHSISEDRWVVWQFGTAVAGTVQAFRRPSNGTANQTVKLRGLTTSASYQLQDRRTGATWTQTGSSLAAGLLLTLPSAPLATTVTYTRL